MTLQPCPLCNRPTNPQLLSYGRRLQPVVTALIRHHTPRWSPADGLCPVCAGDYMRRHRDERNVASLHLSTDPITTFPYYHPEEETVLGQPQRLADYSTYTGAGVTIAFLDSGFYPHPDFAVARTWPGNAPRWHRLSQQQLRPIISQTPLRFVEYVDLTDDGEHTGLATPSLWDSAGDSWHGQMTTAVAAGNGLLSAGRYRGYAPEASLLPIKIGRGGGRIPEEDILRGLTWLLRDDNWQRYGVRVLNISVGGDFPEAWERNPVCRAAHALAQRGVFVAAAAGNRGVEELLAPAQTPSVLTVGGIDDGNRFWRPTQVSDVEQLALYHHNYGSVVWQHTQLRKPEILALARWLPSPILLPSPVLAETVVIDRLRRVLENDDSPVDHYLDHWQRALHEDENPSAATFAHQPAQGSEQWMPEIWHALRRRMNAHKWVHPYYQHVDGTSVSVAQVSGVAAQMLQANSSLLPADIRRLILESALPLPHLVARQTGPGLLQPAAAVAAALRARGGRLQGYPRSGTRLHGSELQKWAEQGKLAVLTLDEHTFTSGSVYYFGIWSPLARCVSLTGSFNRWIPNQLPLQPAGNGWWHTAVRLPRGSHRYRFWVEFGAECEGEWLRDQENPDVAESGYDDGHSVIGDEQQT